VFAADVVDIPFAHLSGIEQVHSTAVELIGLSLRRRYPVQVQRVHRIIFGISGASHPAGRMAV
jgi:hypothetical protein